MHKKSKNASDMSQLELEMMTPREMSEMICEMEEHERFSYPVRFITLNGGRCFVASVLHDDVIILCDDKNDEIMAVYREPTVEEMEKNLVKICSLESGEGIGYDYMNSKWGAKRDPGAASSIHFSMEAYEQLRQIERKV